MDFKYAGRLIHVIFKIKNFNVTKVGNEKKVTIL